MLKKLTPLRGICDTLSADTLRETINSLQLPSTPFNKSELSRIGFVPVVRDDKDGKHQYTITSSDGDCVIAHLAQGVRKAKGSQVKREVEDRCDQLRAKGLEVDLKQIRAEVRQELTAKADPTFSMTSIIWDLKRDTIYTDAANIGALLDVRTALMRAHDESDLLSRKVGLLEPTPDVLLSTLQDGAGLTLKDEVSLGGSFKGTYKAAPATMEHVDFDDETVATLISDLTSVDWITLELEGGFAFKLDKKGCVSSISDSADLETMVADAIEDASGETDSALEAKIEKLSAMLGFYAKQYYRVTEAVFTESETIDDSETE